MDREQPILMRRVIELRDGQRTESGIPMLREEPLSLRINGEQVAVMLRLPGLERELAVGFCLSEGLVRAYADIEVVAYSGDCPTESNDAPRNEIDLRVRPEALNRQARLDVVRLIRAGCGAVDAERSELPLAPLRNELRVAERVVLGMAPAMDAAQVLHRQVGGIHAAALFDSRGQLVVLCEDVGRHNALDKAIGHCALNAIPLQDKLVLCSGRLSYEMVTKAIRVGLPVLASLSTPTALAADLAERYDLTLVGYLRSSRMTLYAHAESITAR
jgi:FdhD protein